MFFRNKNNPENINNVTKNKELKIKKPSEDKQFINRIFNMRREYFSKNRGYNPKNCDITNNISSTNNIPFSSAICLKNGRVAFAPYNNNFITLFGVNDGNVVNRQLPEECKDSRYIDIHYINKGTFILIPADSNTKPLIYDSVTMKYFSGSPIQINGTLKIKDIFSKSVLLDDENVLCINKNTNKCFLYNFIQDTWVGVESNNFIQTKTFSGATLSSDGTVVLLTNRIDIELNEAFIEIYDIKTKVFRKLNISYKFKIDEFCSILPDEDNCFWLIPFKSNKLVHLDLKTLELKEFFIPQEIVEISGSISLGACFSPSGNILISPYEMSCLLEFDIKTKKFIKCPHNESSSFAYTGGIILMTNGYSLAIPYSRKSGIVYGTETSDTIPEIFTNILYNRSN